jgi:hypothetical protein
MATADADRKLEGGEEKKSDVPAESPPKSPGLELHPAAYIA